MTNPGPDEKDEDPTKKAAALRLLRAVLQQDERMVDTLLDGGVNPNCVFDGLPLLTIAAARGVSLSIIRNLYNYGASPALEIKSDIPQKGLRAHDLSEHAPTKTFLLQRSKFITEHFDDCTGKQEVDCFMLGQFTKDTKVVLVQDGDAYLGIDTPCWSNPDHNVLHLDFCPDTILSLIENGTQIVANQTESQNIIQEIAAGFAQQTFFNLN